ncbi:MAG: hypothetical protein AABW86_02800 [Candidatus Micrarchaeota archaeon]
MQPKRKYVRFLPVHALKLATELKKGRARKRIAQEMFFKHGLGQDTTKEYMAAYFPRGEVKNLTPEEASKVVDNQLWSYRQRVKNSEDLREIVQRAEETRKRIGKTTVQITAAMTSEQRKKISIDCNRERERRGTAIWQIALRENNEERSDAAIKREQQKGAEKRSEIARKREKRIAPKRRIRIAKRAEKTRVKRRRALSQFWAKKSHEERKEILRKARSFQKDAERSRRSRAMWKDKTTGQRKQIARKRTADLEQRGGGNLANLGRKDLRTKKRNNTKTMG